jgi:hypothetical protein
LRAAISTPSGWAALRALAELGDETPEPEPELEPEQTDEWPEQWLEDMSAEPAMSWEEIGQALGCSDETARTDAEGAIEKLRRRNTCARFGLSAGDRPGVVR